MDRPAYVTSASVPYYNPHGDPCIQPSMIIGPPSLSLSYAKVDRLASTAFSDTQPQHLKILLSNFGICTINTMDIVGPRNKLANYRRMDPTSPLFCGCDVAGAFIIPS